MWLYKVDYFCSHGVAYGEKNTKEYFLLSLLNFKEFYDPQLIPAYFQPPPQFINNPENVNKGLCKKVKTLRTITNIRFEDKS